jgi:pimeloyl-ACP methyl ester carboxylesterase
VAGDPALEPIEARLAAQPKIAGPTIALQGEADGVHPPQGSATHGVHFTGPYQRRLLPGIGHNPPQEAPQVFADAVLDVIAATKT